MAAPTSSEGRRPSLASSCLLLSIAASWVGVAQLARAAEQVELQRQTGCSLAPLMAWANCTAWIPLCLPHVLRQARKTCSEPARFGRLFRTQAFKPRQPMQFLFVALLTNCAYMAALHFLPASLNTAVFCSSPVFTLLLSALWLVGPSNAGDSPFSCSALCGRKSLSVVLSIFGVALIAEPWGQIGGEPTSGHGSSSEASRRAFGVALSLAAAVGTSLYQVYFKRTFGDTMQPEDVGLFLSNMGALACVLYGFMLALLLSSGIYPLQLSLVPWDLVVATAFCSAAFNFLIKFGLSTDTPIAVSLATQIGIPLNLLLDVVVVRAPIHMPQAIGVAVMLASFTLQRELPCGLSVCDSAAPADPSKVEYGQLPGTDPRTSGK